MAPALEQQPWYAGVPRELRSSPASSLGPSPSLPTPSLCESRKPLTKRERVQSLLLDLRATGQGLPGGSSITPARPAEACSREEGVQVGASGAACPHPAPRSIYC